jgi:hypothetical protein
LLHCKIGVLQRQGGEGGKSLRQLLVLQFDDLGGGVAVLAVPERIDRQHLHVDRHRVHFLQALLNDDEMLRHALDRRPHLFGPVAHQVDGFPEIAVRMHIHGQDRLPLILIGRRGAFGWAWTASSMPQLQKAIPLAAAPSGNSGGWSWIASLDLWSRFPGRKLVAPAHSSGLASHHIAKLDAGGQSGKDRCRYP